MRSGNPNPPNQLRPGHQVTTKHGADGAAKRITRGLPFLGIALQTYDDVLADLGVNPDDLSGIDRVLLERAARFEATARLFNNAAESAALAGNVDAWERYEQRAGWIGGKAYSALRELRDMLHLESGVVVDYEVMLNEAD